MIEDIKVDKLLNLDKTIAKDIFLGIDYPFEALSRISEFIIEIGKTLKEEDYIKKGDNIFISKEAEISPSACINGPALICKGACVRHCAFIRGSAIIGENTVVGNSTELKNVILFDNVQVPHYNYVGDSILGYKSHMGAGAITSNVKSDKSLVTVNVDGEIIKTGLKKFGAVIGDYVEIGCNSVLNPGSIIGRNTNVYPLSMVRGFIKHNSIYKSRNDITEKI